MYALYLIRFRHCNSDACIYIAYIFINVYALRRGQVRRDDNSSRFFSLFVRFVFFPFFFCFSPIIAAAVPLMISCSTKGMLYYIHVLIIRITTIIIVSDRFRKPKLLSITSAYTYTYTHIHISIRACTPYGRTAHTHIILYIESPREYIRLLYVYIYRYDMCTYIVLRSRCICVRKIICARRVRRVRNNI